MSADSHARDDCAAANDNKDGQPGPAASGPVSAATAPRLDTPAAASAEVPGIRPPPVSSGLISLCVVAGQHQRSADPLQLARALGFDPLAELSETQLLQGAKELGLKAKSAYSNWSRLPRSEERR